MGKEIQRNAPCSCGSGKKFKKCCDGKALPRQRHYFSKIDLSSTGSTLSHITGVVSQTLRKNLPKKCKESEDS